MTVWVDALAVEALRITGQNRIDEVVVLDADVKPVCGIDTQDLPWFKIV